MLLRSCDRRIGARDAAPLADGIRHIAAENACALPPPPERPKQCDDSGERNRAGRNPSLCPDYLGRRAVVAMVGAPKHQMRSL